MAHSPNRFSDLVHDLQTRLVWAFANHDSILRQTIISGAIYRQSVAPPARTFTRARPLHASLLPGFATQGAQRRQRVALLTSMRRLMRTPLLVLAALAVLAGSAAAQKMFYGASAL